MTSFPRLAIVPLLAAIAPAQTPCTGAPPGGAAFLADCPCGDVADPQLYFQGTARIGSVQRLIPVSVHGFVPSAFLVLGIATPPVPIPMGLIACGSYSSAPMAPINALAIDALALVPVQFSTNASSPPLYHPLSHYLFVPYVPAAIGVTLHAQYFEQETGLGSVPFVASHTIGFTLQP